MKDLGWKPNRKSHVPLHKQIEEYIKGKILKGEWPVGTRIPSQRQLSDMLEVNRSTVVSAVDELAAQGLLAGKKGGGTRVINNTWSVLAADPPLDWDTYVQSGTYKPNMPTIQEINRAEFHPNIIRLGTGELSPHLLPHGQMHKIWNRTSNRQISLGYPEPKGDLFLRTALADHLQRIGIQTTPSSILIVSGALQALQLISVGLLHRGSSVLLEKPSYLNSVHVFQSAGMKLVGVPVDQEGIQPSLVCKYKRQYGGDLLYIIPSFHNPTGILMSEKRRHDLLATSEQQRLPVVEDDVYRDLWLDNPPPLPLKSHDKNGNVLYVGSFSKTVSPGLRIGWIAGPEPVMDRLADIKMQTDYGSSSLSQWAAAEWLSTGLYQDHLNQVRKELKYRRNSTIKLLEQHFGGVASWSVPSGGFYIWLHIIPSISMRELFETALKEGILLNPGTIYDRDADQYIRISYSYASLEEMEQAISRLSLIMNDLINRRE
ncbi:aminotransferase-like domain-containing protein [Peribacillus glennii]|uniref:PLP-dependent aminotransferase family protein n=1 Tax=Peribacillus glennii TaxID=2303991 RepID=A0A372L985_9BACI|nr:PLP-dependent aminotransferase family protein [Peribacillus glennii]RFU61626.1 PLP-dependent aminotransferase family protein [Peribacillus glennii]